MDVSKDLTIHKKLFSIAQENSLLDYYNDEIIESLLTYSDDVEEDDIDLNLIDEIDESVDDKENICISIV